MPISTTRYNSFIVCKKRRGGDSNSRGPLRTPTGLANPPLQPLGYLSAMNCILAKIRKIKRAEKYQ